MKTNRLFIQSILTLLFLITTSSVVAQEEAHFSWVKTMGGSDADNGGAIAVDADGNVYTTGYFRNTADFDPGTGTFNLTSAGIIDIFICKVDSDGNFVWAHRFGSTEYDRGFGIDVDSDGNVYCSGYFGNTVDFDPGPGTANLSTSDYDFFILKLDTDGDFIWVKGIGDFGGDYARAMTVDDAQNVYITGEFRSTVDFDPGPGVYNLTNTGSNGDAFILKLDAAGDFEWARSHGGSSGDEGRSIKVDELGNVYTTGIFYSTVDFDPGAGTFSLTSAGSGDVFISKLDINGNFVWAKQLGSTGNDKGQCLALDNSGNVYATGEFYQTVDFDPGAGTFNQTAVDGDAYVVKLNTAGNFVWAKKMSGPNFDTNFSLAVGPDGSVYTAGDYYGIVDFGTETNIFHEEVNGDCIVKLSTDGDLVWATTYTGTSIEYGMAITVNADDNVYVTGQFFRADFDPSGCVNEVTSVATDIYILKWTQGPPFPEPTIVSFNPLQGPPGTTVTLTGTNFDAVPSNNVVMFNGTIAQVTNSTTTTLTVTVPQGATDGQISVSINCATATSAEDFITGEATGDGLVIYNAISANADNKNDFFRLENIETYAANTVTIFNRWGDVVFDVKDYNNTDRVFKGISNSGKDLPSGIYYYKIELTSGKTQTGYLSLKR